LQLCAAKNRILPANLRGQLLPALQTQTAAVSTDEGKRGRRYPEEAPLVSSTLEARRGALLLQIRMSISYC